ncbi:site-specific DNA-methyltransferase [Ferrimonas marina]|uniref:site-specific DNA-methyltransferase (adenine-specific) n=1 Tax=Ferrimonas marina TaxID=299255 RepID=A0A1M5XCB3_9GAMM|nr:site-specific DNA-methyltransferase [Ferrimonas marina]SHH97292.1 adenine-specific DNA-methyltransferase [Ferrimonas marina]
MDIPKKRRPGKQAAALRQLAKLFPHCVQERYDPQGRLCPAADWQALAETLGGAELERYQLNWPGKAAAQALADSVPNAAFAPSACPDLTSHSFIEGDNLEAMKLLQPSHAERLKLVYIDPPYNTGKTFAYSDNYRASPGQYPDSDAAAQHSPWLSMMLPRLILAHRLLRPDGAIVIHIDEHEHANLEKLLGEVFGEHNHLGTLVWDKRNPKGDARGVAQQHELICLYAKDKARLLKAGGLKRPKPHAEAMRAKVAALVRRHGGVNEPVRKAFRQWLEAQPFSQGAKAYRFIDDEGEIYRPVSMAWPNKKVPPEAYFRPLRHPGTDQPCPVPKRGWRNPPATMARLQAQGEILFGEDHRTQPTRKYRLCDHMLENLPSVIYHAGSDDALLAQLGIPFDTPKVVAISRMLIAALCGPGDIVLDCFAGSGTTGHAVLEHNRATGDGLVFVLVELPVPLPEDSVAAKAGFTTVAQLGLTRLQRVLQPGEQMGHVRLVAKTKRHKKTRAKGSGSNRGSEQGS